MEKYMNIKYYRGLCVKAITGNISIEENTLLDDWLKDSEKSRTEFETLKKLWDKSLLYSQVELPDEDTEWNELLNRIKQEPNEKGKEITWTRKFIKYVKTVNLTKWKPAYGIVAIVLILSALFLLLNREPEVYNLKIFNSSDKEQMVVNLPDGSSAILNRNSEIKYPDKFTGGSREIELNGEAFFSVAKSKIPFVVSTKNAKTTVLGTKFNVWARGNETRVIVKEGKVKLNVKKNDAPGVVLTKGQLSFVKNNELPVKPEDVNANFLLGWIDGKLVFDKKSLADIALDIEKYYNVSVALDNDSLKSLTLTGAFKNNNVDSVLTMICLALNLDFEKRQNGYLIRMKDTERR